MAEVTACRPVPARAPRRPRAPALAAALVALGFALLGGGCATDSKLREADLGRLAALLPGRYDNAEPPAAAGAASSKPELALQLDVVRIYAPFIGEHVFYAQEGVVGDARRVLSQRLLVLAVEEGRIVQNTLGLADPVRWRNGHRDPDLFKALMYTDVVRGAAGCGLEWRAADGGFAASVLPGAGCDASAGARLDLQRFEIGGLSLRRR
jgi:hypothetical protein